MESRFPKPTYEQLEHLSATLLFYIDDVLGHDTDQDEGRFVNKMVSVAENANGLRRSWLYWQEGVYDIAGRLSGTYRGGIVR